MTKAGLIRALVPVICITFLLLTSESFAQVEVQRSKDKVVIAGKPYYIHVVKKGETSYSISRAYGIKVDELVKENPAAANGIREGQTLRLPIVERQSRPGTQTSAVTRDESKFIYHKLKTGDTVYSLARLYGVSEEEILRSNPGVEINKLPVNAEIAIPRKQFTTVPSDLGRPEKEYINHRVVRGESIASIAEKYGVSVRDLRKENRGLLFPKVDDLIRVPVLITPEAAKSELPAIDSAALKTEEPDTIPVRPLEFTSVRDLRGSFDVAVLLPMYFRENSIRTETDSSQLIKGKRVYKRIRRADQWIYPGTIPFLEMYQGILLAADTLRAMGLDLRLHLFDIKRDSIGLIRLIESGRLSDMELIIGPVYSHNLSIAARYADEKDIPVVSPVPLKSNSILKDRSLLFMANPSIQVAQEFIAERISNYPRSNIVFIHADSSRSNPDVVSFRNVIFRKLSDKIPYEDIRFKELMFYSRSAISSDSINRLEHTLTDKADNLVIIASEEPAILSETIMDIHTLSRRYPVRIIGYPAMRELVNLEPKYFFELGIELYSPYWIDYSSADVRSFIKSYRRKFLTEPGEMSYAWQGYDITYYFLSGLAMHGKRFTRRPYIHNPDLLQTVFDFRRSAPGDGFENRKLYLIKFTGEMEVVVIDEPIPELDSGDR